MLLVDDIFDTGHTLWELIPQIDELGPLSVRSAVLLQKEGRCEVPMKPDFVGFTIPNEFVVGYGLDYRDLYRNLPYWRRLEPGETMTKRILEIIPTLDRAGAEKQLCLLAAGLPRDEFDVHVCA